MILTVSKSNEALSLIMESEDVFYLEMIPFFLYLSHIMVKEESLQFHFSLKLRVGRRSDASLT